MLVHLFKMNKSLKYSLNERHLSGKVICIRHNISGWMTQGCLFMAFGLIPLLAPISLFLQLLSPYYTFVVLLGTFIFSSLQFAAIILLLEVPSYFISWNIQVSMIFLYISQSKCYGADHFLRFELNCRNNKKCYAKKTVVSDCFNNFSVFSQTCTSYRNTALSSCSSFTLSSISFLHDYRIYSHFGAHHLFVLQVSPK